MNVLEYEINGKVYQFKASFKFLHEVNSKVKVEVAEFKQSQQKGLVWLVANMIDGDVDALVDTLFAMNIGQSPRVTKTDLESFIEDHSDIDSVFEEVLNFLFKANVCKKALKDVKKIYEEQKEPSK